MRSERDLVEKSDRNRHGAVTDLRGKGVGQRIKFINESKKSKKFDF